MAALVGGQAQRARDAVEHLGRNVDRQALLEARVPGRADIGEQRDLFAPQARRAAPRAVGEADVGGDESSRVASGENRSVRSAVRGSHSSAAASSG